MMEEKLFEEEEFDDDWIDTDYEFQVITNCVRILWLF